MQAKQRGGSDCKSVFVDDPPPMAPMLAEIPGPRGIRPDESDRRCPPLPTLGGGGGGYYEKLNFKLLPVIFICNFFLITGGGGGAAAGGNVGSTGIP